MGVERLSRIVEFYADARAVCRSYKTQNRGYGLNPVGHSGVPESAFKRVILPRLNCPTTATRSRPFFDPGSTALSFARISPWLGVGSGTDASALAMRTASEDMIALRISIS